MKVIGFRRSSFKGDDGQPVSGVNVYLTRPLQKGEGLESLRIYLTDAKLADCGYTPKIGDEVRAEYNEWGKCSGLFVQK